MIDSSSCSTCVRACCGDVLLNFRADQNLLYLKARPQRAVELRRRCAKSLRCEPCFAVAAASRRERLRSRSSLALELFDLGEERCAARVHPETVGSKRRECGSLSRLSDSTSPVKWAMRLPAYQLPLQAGLARRLPRPSGTGALSKLLALHFGGTSCVLKWGPLRCLERVAASLEKLGGS